MKEHHYYVYIVASRTREENMAYRADQPYLGRPKRGM
jgi:hypothetical protein